MRLVIGSRQSDLARLQAFEVGRKLQAAAPDLDIQYHFKESLGDKNLTDPLWKMPERGVFTEDFYQALVQGEVDLVVHSWKDLPIEERQVTQVSATLKRADVRDVLLFKKNRLKTCAGQGKVRFFSSSPRRAYNGEEFFKWALPFESQAEFLNIRGNIPTRLKKYMEGEADGIILAKAALDRLLSSNEVELASARSSVLEALGASLFMLLPLRVNPAAPAQGALAIETVPGRNHQLDLILASINEPEDFENALAERKCLARYGGGCHQKIGVTYLTRDYGTLKFLRGKTDDGEVLTSVQLDASKKFPKTAAAKAWSPGEEDGSLFDRRNLGVRKPLGVRAFWVTKSAALPEDWSMSSDDVVWTGGLETWKKLARRGVWVNGSSEGFGEHEDPRLEHLAGSPSWTKLTHTRGFESMNMEMLKTYELISSDLRLDLQEKTHFYWSSGSQFQEAVGRFPQIVEGYHGCGPGNTYQVLKKYFDHDPDRLAIFLDENDWKEKVVIS